MAENTPLRQVPHLTELDSLRGLMAIWVVLGHVVATFPLPFAGWLPLRLLADNVKAVDIFIILSGFVIFNLIEKRQEPYFLYIARRFLRLWPAYIACFLISVPMAHAIVDMLAALTESTQRNADRITILQASLAHPAQHVAAHLLMLHGLIPNTLLPYTDFAYMGQAWSISVEFQFYLLAPLAVMLLGRGYAGIGILGVLVAGLYAVKGRLGMGYVGGHLPFFIIGAASYYLWKTSDAWAKSFSAYSAYLMAAMCVGIIVVLPKYWHLAIWGCVLCSIIAVKTGSPARLVNGISRGLRSAPLLFLGRISYSIYLSHMIVLYSLLILLTQWHVAAGWLAPLCFTGTLGLTLALSAFLYRQVELPGINFGKKLGAAPDIAPMLVPAALPEEASPGA